MGNVGVVIIGRNEGERLRNCLDSVAGSAPCIYVDSGSTDDSTGLAQSRGVAVVNLSTSSPFTAARARNTGVARLLELHPELEYVLCIDGDCELHPNWLKNAQTDMGMDVRRAVVFGRRRERCPDLNAYHAACDDEWAAPFGEVSTCGGDALIRLQAFSQVNGYNGALIAGEEPDMCLRLRQQGWTIWSNCQDMTLHDVDMNSLRQWWLRSRRAGYAFSKLVALHGGKADPSWRRLVHSALAWTSLACIGLLMAGASLILHSTLPGVVAGAVSIVITLQVLRLVHSKRSRIGVKRSLQWSVLIMIAKVAQSFGYLQYCYDKVTQRHATLIEYKS